MDRLTSMAVFITAADSGSFATAANTLNISAQMVGKHILALEQRVGSKLLHRTTRRQSLTEAGRLYYQRCKSLLEQADAADRLMESIHAEPVGLLRVNAPVTFGYCSLMPALTRYMRRYPQVQVSLTLSDRYVDLIEDGYEAVFRLGELRDSSLKARKLAPYRCLVCASPAYLAEHGIPQLPIDLLKHECIGFTSWANTPSPDWEFTKDGKTEYIKINSRLQINDCKATLNAALNHFGIILGAETMLQDSLTRGELVKVLPQYQALSRPMHILFHGERQLSPRLRTFVDFIVQEFGITESE